MKKILAIILTISFVFSFILQNINLFNNSVNAQTIQNMQAAPCVNLAYNMTIGSRDSGTEGEVTKLQIFLIVTGFLNHEPTGYFGTLTRTALAKYQAVNGISPAAGYFGPITRAFINKDTCSGYVPSNPSSKPTYYCDLNGISYLNENDYKKNCVSVSYSFICGINGQSYSSEAEYNAKCKNTTTGNNNNFFCALNGLIYYSSNDYNNYCKIPDSQNPQNYICVLNYEYQGGGFVATNDCACPLGSTRISLGNFGEIYKWKCVANIY